MDIQVNDVSKIYGTGENKVVALCHANMTIHSGDFISIMGPSGSGKSTLLHIISGLDTPTSGKVLYGDTRVGEIGMQRAIGMSAASLYKTFLWEGAYYAIFASVIGAVLGYVCCIFVGAAKTDTLQLVTVPVMAIIEAAVVSVAACLLATAIPLRSIAKMNIVESIENVE